MLIERMNQKSTSVRKAILGDTEAVVDLVNSAYRGESSKAGWTTEADILGGQRTDSNKILEIINNPNSALLIMLTAENKICACVHLEKLSYAKAYLGMLTVMPIMQVGGIGKSLLNTAEIFARESWQSQEIEMTVISLRTELINWYKRRGYTLSEERRAFPVSDPSFGLPKRKDLEFVVLYKQL
jgi:N-acetylglutamate synthase-like GNAT family acetyltransferase